METLKYNIWKQELREVKERGSKEIIERAIYKELEEDLTYISSFDEKVRLSKVEIENEYIKVVFQVAEQRFTLFDYKILKTLILDDIEDCFK